MLSPRCGRGRTLALWLLPLASAAAEPMDLRDPTPREVGVEFEISPRDHPEQLDAVYAPRLPGHLRPHATPGWIVVEVPGAAVEQVLMASEHPKPGSFGDFAWIFDSESGDVIAATLEGVVYRRVQLGPFHSTIEAAIRVLMTTAEPVGFRPPRGLLGHRIFDACTLADSDPCTLVQPARYDPASGYVNAVGRIFARGAKVSTETFSSLGEARFFELSGAPAVAAAQR